MSVMKKSVIVVLCDTAFTFLHLSFSLGTRTIQHSSDEVVPLICYHRYGFSHFEIEFPCDKSLCYVGISAGRCTFSVYLRS